MYVYATYQKGLKMNLSGKDFLKILDFSKEEIMYLLNLSKELKEKKQKGESHEYLKGKNVALIFEKDSTRTRCAFEVGAYDLGMNVTYLGPSGSQMGKKESIADTAKVLSRMYDGIEYRGFSQSIVEDLAKNSRVPVWNGLTDEYHPTQMLADILTVMENLGEVRGLNFTFMGDARNNMGNSYMVICSKLGINFTACAPKELWPQSELIETCKVIAEKEGSSLNFTEDPMEGTKNADVVATDVWVSMGEADDVWEKRINLLKPYQVNKVLMNNAKDSAIFLHCLPSFHDLNTKLGKEIGEKFNITAMEVSDEVFSSSQSKVFDEAENRLHTIKAVMLATLK